MRGMYRRRSPVLGHAMNSSDKLTELMAAIQDNCNQLAQLQAGCQRATWPERDRINSTILGLLRANNTLAHQINATIDQGLARHATS